MYNAQDFVVAVKRAALEAVAQENPVGVTFGTVVSASPLSIQIDQKLTVGQAQLIPSALVRDFTVSMTVAHETQPNSGGQPPPHTHAYTGIKVFAVHLALKAGERVVMLREQGGQRYYILDRVVNE